MKSEEEIFIREVVKDMEEHNKGLLHEFYITANSDRDKNILKDLKIHIYNLDRDQMTPHCHIKTKNGEIELEVSLLDWTIVNVKAPKNTAPTWSNFSGIKDKFFEWLNHYHEKSDLLNSYWLFYLWDGENPDNQLKKYKDNPNNSNPLKDYLERNEMDIDLDRLQKDLYSTLVPLFLNKTAPQLDGPIQLLKNIELYRKYPVKETDEKAIKLIVKTYNELKTWGINY